MWISRRLLANCVAFFAASPQNFGAILHRKYDIIIPEITFKEDMI